MAVVVSACTTECAHAAFARFLLGIGFIAFLCRRMLCGTWILKFPFARKVNFANLPRIRMG